MCSVLSRDRHSHRALYGHSHVDRTYLVERLLTDIEQDGIALMSAPEGYGKSMLCSDVAREHARRSLQTAPCVTICFSTRPARSFTKMYGAMRSCGDSPAKAMRAAWAESLLAKNRQLALGRRRPAPVDETSAGRMTRDRESFSWEPPDKESVLFSALFDEAHVCYIWAMICSTCPDWVESLRSGDLPVLDEEGEGPLVVLDDIPLFEDGEMRQRFVRAIRVWHSLGASFILSSLPSACLYDTYFSDCHCLQVADLAVSASELNLWMRDLCLDIDLAVLRELRGIPALIDACRHHAPCDANALLNTEILRRSKAIMSSVLAEKTDISLKRTQIAMALLGSGSMADLKRMGVGLITNDLLNLERNYPVFGVDLRGAGFSCLSVVPQATDDLATYAGKLGEESLVTCINLLLKRGDYRRASLLMRVVDPASLVKTFEDRPFRCADAAPAEVGNEVLRAAAARLPGEGRCDLGDFAGARTLLTKGMTLQEVKEGAMSVSLRTLAWVQTAWERVGHGSMRADGSAPAVIRDCDALVAAAVEGNQVGVAAHRETLLQHCGKGDGVMERLIRHQVALAGFLSGDVDETFAWLGPYVQRASGIVGTASAPGFECLTGSLLEADWIFARLLSCPPQEQADAERDIARLRALALVFEHRSSWAFAAQTRLLEALACMASGYYARARQPLADAIKHYNKRGALLGQVVTFLCRALCELACQAVPQAEVELVPALRMASQLASSRWEDATRLLSLLVEAAKNEGQALPQADLEANLLSCTLRVSGQYPHVSLSARLTRALLASACGDLQTAHADFETLEATGPCGFLLAVSAASVPGAFRQPAEGALTPRMKATVRKVVSGGDSPFFLLAGGAREDRPLAVRLFSTANIELNGHRIDDMTWGRRKSRDLLLCLALSDNGELRREEAARILWPALDYEASSSNLSTVLSSLRKVLGQVRGGPQYILADGQRISLNPALAWVDVSAFERAARAFLTSSLHDYAEVEPIAGQFTREYGDGIDLSRVPSSHMASERAARVDELFADCLLRAASSAKEAGRLSDGFKLVRNALRAMPHRADAECLLAELVATASRAGVLPGSGEPGQGDGSSEELAAKIAAGTGAGAGVRKRGRSPRAKVRAS